MQTIPAGRLKEIVKKFRNRKIAVFGDMMMDHYIRGKVSRISPEAPVPVVHVKEEGFLAGGAGNVACNLADLGADVKLLSVIGNDTAGQKLLNKLNKQGVDVSLVVKDKTRPTTEKVRVIAEHQQVVRFDRETSEPISEKICLECRKKIKRLAGRCSGFVLSDYGKGVLSDANIAEAVSRCNTAKIPVCVDPKIENFAKYKKVTCITPNTKEAYEGMRRTLKEGQKEIENLAKDIIKTLGSKSVLITQGANGMTLCKKGKPSQIWHTDTCAREVFDVTGAGDTVISVLTLALACGAQLKEAAALANISAGIVVGKLGTATLLPEELLKEIDIQCAKTR